MSELVKKQAQEASEAAKRNARNVSNKIASERGSRFLSG
jgi:hypothetical protein